jgi:hypothetical protein
VKDVLQYRDITQLFNVPLSSQAFNKLQQAQQIIQNRNLSLTGADSWKTIWKDGIFSANKFYHYTFRDQVPSPIYSMIWKSKCLLRIKVFPWLIVSDRINTKDMLHRRKK